MGGRPDPSAAAGAGNRPPPSHSSPEDLAYAFRLGHAVPSKAPEDRRAVSTEVSKTLHFLYDHRKASIIK